MGPSSDQPGAATEGDAGKIFTRRRAGWGALALVLLAIAAGGGYLAGSGSGEDLDAARVAGGEAGWSAGTAIGGDIYPAGLEKGRRITYGRAFRDSFRTAYRQAFRGTGIDVPNDDDIEVAVP